MSLKKTRSSAPIEGCLGREGRLSLSRLLVGLRPSKVQSSSAKLEKKTPRRLWFGQCPLGIQK